MYWAKCKQSKVSQLYVHISFCLKVIRSSLNLPTGGHGHMICMGEGDWTMVCHNSNTYLRANTIKGNILLFIKLFIIFCAVFTSSAFNGYQ